MNNLLAPAYCHDYTETGLSPAEQWGNQMAVEA